MQLTLLTSLALTLFTTFSFVLPAAAEPFPVASPEELAELIELAPRDTNEYHKLRITTGKNYGPPYGPPVISGYVEIANNYQAVWNRTKGYTGFPVTLKPGPMAGRVTKTRTGHKGYLKPTKPGYYDFMFQTKIPDESHMLWKNFTIQGRDCGGNCGGLDFRYASQYGSLSTFYAVRRAAAKHIWEIKYTKDQFKFPVPAGGSVVYLWWESVVV